MRFVVALVVLGDLESLSPAIVVEELVDLARGSACEGDDEMGKKERRKEETGGLDGRKLKCPHEVTPREELSDTSRGKVSDWRPGLLGRLAGWLAKWLTD